MAEYINRRDAQIAIWNKEEHFFADDRFPDSEFAYNDALIVAANALDELPAADVAPVVYCKDCVHLGFKDCYGVCEGGPMCGIVRPYDYCSHGKRMDERSGDE